MWGHQALIAPQMSFFRAANENLRTANQLLGAIGSGEQLQIHSPGGEIPISEVVDGKTLMFLQRYKHLLEKGTKELSARQLRLQTLEPISNFKNSQREHVTGSLGGEGESFAELDEKLQQMSEEEKRKLDKELREKLKQALTELRRRREKKKKRTVSKEKTQQKKGVEPIQLDKNKDQSMANDELQQTSHKKPSSETNGGC